MVRLNSLRSIVITFIVLGFVKNSDAGPSDNFMDLYFKNGAFLSFPVGREFIVDEFIFTTAKGVEERIFSGYGDGLKMAKVHYMPEVYRPETLGISTEFGNITLRQDGVVRLLSISAKAKSRAANEAEVPSELSERSASETCHQVTKGGATGVGLGQNSAIYPRNFESDGIPERGGYDIDSGTSGAEGLH